jgi:trans-aconitate methyltransferase
VFSLSEYVAETLDIGPGTRVFEVDCGRGEFLLPLHQNGYIVGGIDADAHAIRDASAALPNSVFQVGTASALDPAVPWDVVVCRSLAAKDDLSTAALAKADHLRGLVARMLAKATHAIALLDVPEQHHRALLHAMAEAGAHAIQIEGAHVFARV